MGRRVLEYPALLVGAAAALAFIPSLAAGFVVDDLRLIVENPYAQSLSYLPRVFVTHLWDVHGSTTDPNQYYRPLVSASYILNWVVADGAAWPFHLFNVIVHAAAAVLAARIACRWLRSDALGVLAGLAFALHPTRTESVIWISGRTDVLMTLFVLCAVELAHEASRSTGARQTIAGVGFALCALASLLSKEPAVILPVLVAVDWTAGRVRNRQFPVLIGVSVLLSVVYVCARWWLLPIRSATVFQPWMYGVSTLGAYVERVMWPWPQTLHYSPLSFTRGVPEYPTVSLALGMGAALGFLLHAAALWRRRDWSTLLLLGALFATVVPILNFVQTGLPQMTADRFLYAPLFLLTCVALRSVGDRAKRWVRRPAAWAAVGLLAAVSLAINIDRVGDFRNQETFWQHELSVNPHNPHALVSVADAALARDDTGRARALLRQALEPEAQRFLFSNPLGARLRLVGMEVDSLADGDVSKLHAYLLEIASWCGNEETEGTKSGFCRHSRIEHAFVLGTLAVRLGNDELGKQWLGSIDDAFLGNKVPSPANLVLAHARLSNFAEARRLLDVMVQGGPGFQPVDSATVRDLRARVTVAESAFRQSRSRTGSAAAVLEATAMAELGAYLRALQVIQPLLADEAGAAAVRPLLVQLLVAARLEVDALQVARVEMSEDEALIIVNKIRSQLPPRVQNLPPVEDPGWKLRGASFR
jgi:hypothetical protein